MTLVLQGLKNTTKREKNIVQKLAMYIYTAYYACQLTWYAKGLKICKLRYFYDMIRTPLHYPEKEGFFIAEDCFFHKKTHFYEFAVEHKQFNMFKTCKYS
jgi:hypothetical protein